MATKEELLARKDKFIEAYLGAANGNGAEAARLAGYSANRASITASELLKDPYIQEKIRKANTIKQENLTDSPGTIDDIFAAVSPEALRMLANQAKINPDAAQKFIKLKFDYDKHKEETVGTYEGLSTEEIVGRFNNCIERGRELISRIMEETGAESLQEGSDLPSEPSSGEYGSEEEPMGASS